MHALSCYKKHTELSVATLVGNVITHGKQKLTEDHFCYDNSNNYIYKDNNNCNDKAAVIIAVKVIVLVII